MSFMDHGKHAGFSRKRKINGVRRGQPPSAAKKVAGRQKVLRGQGRRARQVAHLAPRPLVSKLSTKPSTPTAAWPIYACLRTPDFDQDKPVPGRRRYYAFSVTKMARLLRKQTRFLCAMVHAKDANATHFGTYKTLSHHIGMAKADCTSNKLATFYVAKRTIRGTCHAKQKHRKCVVLGVEHRQEAPSFRLYLAYFSPTRCYYVCYVRFLIKMWFLRHGMPLVLVQTVLEYCMHGLVRKGFEIVGAHYMPANLAQGKPKICEPKSKRPRTFVNMWQGQCHPKTIEQINFLLSHARRDVQIWNLRTESKVYTQLVRGQCEV